VNVTNSADLAKRIGQGETFRIGRGRQETATARGASDRWRSNEIPVAIARELQAFVKKNPPPADYVLYADYMFNRQHWEQAACSSSCATARANG